MKGIEPSSVAWEATALPLSYTREAASLFCGVWPMQTCARSRAHVWANLRRCVDQKLPLRVTNPVALVPPFCPTVVVTPISAASPNTTLRAPRVRVP